MFNFALPFQKDSESIKTKPRVTAVPKTKQLSNIDRTRFMAMNNDIMMVINEDATITYANSTLMNIIEKSEQDLLTLNFLTLFHEEDRPYIRNTIQTMGLKADTMDIPTLDFEARLIAPNGNEHWIEWRANGHNFETYFTGRDITQIKKSKLELTQQQNQLQAAESIGRLGRWNWTIGQEAIEWSDEIYRICGVTQDTFTPTFENIYHLLDSDDQDRMDQTMQRAVINQNDFDVDFCIIRPDGERRYIRCDGRCATNSEGEAIALYGIMQDMTERTLYERELKNAKEAAEASYAAKSQFLANMSHELRTPLNAIIGFSEMMETQIFGDLGNEKYLEYATNIRSSGAHLLDLISDILDMSKIEAGKYEINLEEAKINAIVETAIQMIETRAQEMNIEVFVHEDFTHDQIIIADRRACLQIMLNILSNAVKFTREDGHIEITCRAFDDHITIKVRDNGIGIPANKLASITRPFEQISSHYTRDHEGSGLGLAITKELIEMHGGELIIESEINIGTDVIIKLPMTPPDTANGQSMLELEDNLFFEN